MMDTRPMQIDITSNSQTVLRGRFRDGGVHNDVGADRGGCDHSNVGTSKQDDLVLLSCQCKRSEC